MGRKEELREQLAFAEKNLWELKAQRDQLLEQGQPADDLLVEIDHLTMRIMNMLLQSSKY